MKTQPVRGLAMLPFFLSLTFGSVAYKQIATKRITALFEETTPAKTLSAASLPAMNQQDKDKLRTLINEYRRAKDGTQAVAFNDILNKAAQEYANRLEETGLTGHTVAMAAPNGKTVTQCQDRVAIAALTTETNSSAPYIFSYVSADAFSHGVHICNTRLGEILAYGHGTPEQAIEGWKKSTMGHDGNMRNKDWTHIGIGISKRKLAGGQFSGFNWVVVFGTPNPDQKTQINLDGTYKGVQFPGQYRYYTILNHS